MQPDQPTKERIKNLAVVGKAIYEAFNEENYDTNFYLAKEALIEFDKGIKVLDLDQESKQGMQKLINYLDEKIDKRMKKTI